MTTLEDLFGESVSNCGKIFHHVCHVLMTTLYHIVRFPETDTEWDAEIRDFLEDIMCWGRGMGSTLTLRADRGRGGHIIITHTSSQFAYEVCNEMSTNITLEHTCLIFVV